MATARTAIPNARLMDKPRFRVNRVRSAYPYGIEAVLPVCYGAALRLRRLAVASRAGTRFPHARAPAHRRDVVDARVIHPTPAGILARHAILAPACRRRDGRSLFT